MGQVGQQCCHRFGADPKARMKVDFKDRTAIVSKGSDRVVGESFDVV